MARPSPTPGRTPPPLATVGLAVAMGTLFALSDAVIYSGEAPARAAELFDALREMAIATTAASLAFGLLWLLVVGLAGRFLRVPAGPLTYGLVGCLAWAYLMEFFSVRPRAGILAVALPYGLLTGLAAHRWWATTVRRFAGTAALSMPAGALGGLAVLWVHKFAVDAGSGATTAIRPGWGQWAALAGAWLTVVGLLTALGGRRPALSRAAMWGTAVIAVVVSLLSPCLEHSLTTRHRPAGDAAPAIPHVLLIVVDALRPDTLSCYGNDAFETPAFDRLAADGIVFEQARAPAPWTVPSMATVLTGTSPWTHRVTRASNEIPDEIPTLAERMHAGGYATAAIGRNKFLCRGRFNRGFQHVDFFPRRRIHTPLADTLGTLWRRSEAGTGTTPDITRRATAWLKDRRETNGFLWLHVFDPHMPYEPGAAFMPEGPISPRIGFRFGSVRAVRAGRFVPTTREKRWIQGLYQGEVRAVDHYLGRLLTRLDELGMYDDALIVLTSDHGEEFWEHDGWEHGHTLYDELLSVPLIVKLPGSARVDRIATPVSLGSLMPTILEMGQIEGSEGPFSYPSIASLLEGQLATEMPPAQFATGQLYYEPREAVKFEGYKFIRWKREDRHELFDLTADPGEQHDVAEDHPWEVARAGKLLDGYELSEVALRERLGAIDRESPLDADTEDHLRSLGYIE